MTRFSVVIPTFQRGQVVSRSIDSALAFARVVGGTEVVVIDDASSDGTTEKIREVYSDEINQGLIVLLRRPQNGGVTAAKNDGARTASGEWVIFLDSDDQLLPTAAVIPIFAGRYATAPILFFRCEDEKGQLVGAPAAESALDLAALLIHGIPGECLPVVARKAILAHPYDEDLRGFELLAYLRMVQVHGPAVLSDAVLRSYATTSSDRLSTLAGRVRRARLMARGFGRTLREFGHLLPLRRRLALGVRAVAYAATAAIFGY
jgi:glycosyltransferase involved in cell wall biosynthesis